ncbi:protein of unknown function [Klenkia marina]|uniref:DUF4192 domain-containing protein n=1 Tax=Klenkia marina TaxID=1960309 RepID=A0A1G4Z2F9_9ACTN|nr:DUF4192 domain-containing protein [Klenkia marina]SCX59883.1 protein of unknown function [Klenkia marina]
MPSARRSRRPRPRPAPPRPEPRPRAGVLRGRAEEFAAALPEVLGFRPVESLVVLCFGGGGRRPKELVFTVRLDLVDVEHDEDLVAAVRDQVRRIQPLPRRAMFFVVTEDADDQVEAVAADPWRVVPHRPDADVRPLLPDLPRRALVHTFVEAFDGLGIGTHDALLVRGGRWWSYPDVDPLTGAAAGQPLDVEGSRLTGVAALNGQVVETDRAAAAARAWPTAPPTIAVLGACQRAEDALVTRLGDGDLDGVVADYRTVVDDALRAHEPGSRVALTPDALAAVAAGLLLVPVRDHALAMTAAPVHDDRGEAAAAAAEILWTELVTRLPDDLAGVPALLMGTAAWLRGSGVLAVSALERSLVCEPTPMAEMLLDAVRANTPPAVLRAVLTAPGDGGAG